MGKEKTKQNKSKLNRTEQKLLSSPFSFLFFYSWTNQSGRFLLTQHTPPPPSSPRARDSRPRGHAPRTHPALLSAGRARAPTFTDFAERFDVLEKSAAPRAVAIFFILADSIWGL